MDAMKAVPAGELLPENGVSGPGVAHVDGATQTDDWRREFGPGMPDTYAAETCLQFCMSSPRFLSRSVQSTPTTNGAEETGLCRTFSTRG